MLKSVLKIENVELLRGGKSYIQKNNQNHSWIFTIFGGKFHLGLFMIFRHSLCNEQRTEISAWIKEGLVKNKMWCWQNLLPNGMLFALQNTSILPPKTRFWNNVLGDTSRQIEIYLSHVWNRMKMGYLLNTWCSTGSIHLLSAQSFLHQTSNEPLQIKLQVPTALAWISKFISVIKLLIEWIGM